MKKIYLPAFILLLVLFAFQGFAQKENNASVRGFVYEAETGEPAMFCNVYLDGTTYGSSTDINGYFLISQAAPGKYTLIITYLGYDTIRMPVTLINNNILNTKFQLKK